MLIKVFEDQINGYTFSSYTNDEYYTNSLYCDGCLLGTYTTRKELTSILYKSHLDVGNYNDISKMLYYNFVKLNHLVARNLEKTKKYFIELRKLKASNIVELGDYLLEFNMEYKCEREVCYSFLYSQYRSITSDVGYKNEIDVIEWKIKSIISNLIEHLEFQNQQTNIITHPMVCIKKRKNNGN